MINFKNSKIYTLLSSLYNPGNSSPEHYVVLRRLIITIMLIVTTLPMGTMIVINHFQYRNHLRNEITTPILTLANKTKHSFEILLEARLSTVRFIATAYTYEELNDSQNIKRILMFLKKEFGGFVDLGLIDSNGILNSYAGPYPLLGKNYSEQTSFQETLIKGKYISNVFLGHRKFPHIVVAVQHLTDEGKTWILRATIDTDKFDSLIQSMGLDPKSDAFLIDTQGVFQTNSKFYGKTLEQCPFDIPSQKFESHIYETVDPEGQEVVIASVGFNAANYTLVIVKPRSVVLQSWYALKTELFIVFLIGLFFIVIAIFKITNSLILRLKESDEKRENTLAELQHTQKLSSIGRLAAGVAHEINNPLAIINEKAGLMNDIMEFSADFSQSEKFRLLIASILKSVERCRKITHRLLGFAKRIEVQRESMDTNAVIKEVLGFLEREALYRKIDIRLNLMEPLNIIVSDRGQIQQVFLNLLTNAFDAVKNGGIINIKTENMDEGGIKIQVNDNGCGIPEDIIKHVFDPFFSTKKEKGTGLGLSISYGIIDRLGGSISVSSHVNQGTEFTIILPKISEHSPEEHNEHPTN
ncbi:Integral membrane sensor signal transduction histidine kinase [Desulfamplus magnetovallimortis]|uniref:histidine kinase n=1 Tax=Desulfamplus magnetovallimortis TaxID=1246637 RepID=A0A1W1HFG5_9BACT|nr:PAS domain-containing sensor histidine kinase [Desulfamplus magnetovallimortis]SLM31227.1 Integral membrane sensor signal transduction histidine kinase [Desulfamplus magnetovallimortis]